jgi:hypothetical protein
VIGRHHRDMHVLMLQTGSAGSSAAAADLARHGYEVVVCHPDGDETCVALAGGRCPLDAAPVDAAVVVRPYAADSALPLEDGVYCAARRGIPLVVAGQPAGHPFGAWASAEEEGTAVGATVDTVLASPLPRLSTIATATLRQALARRGITETPARVEVRRRHGGVAVELIGVDDLAADAKAAASVRVAGAIRAVDPWVRSIDVAVRP